MLEMDGIGNVVVKREKTRLFLSRDGEYAHIECKNVSVTLLDFGGVVRVMVYGAEEVCKDGNATVILEGSQ